MRAGSAGLSAGSVWRRVALGAAFAAVVVVLMLWLAGVFHPKIDTRRVESAVAARRPVGDREIAPVLLIRVPRMESAVGTIRAVHETAIASKLLAKVVEANVQAGRNVTRGQVLFRLDDEDLQARLEQAGAAVAAARAARDQAIIEFDRVKSLFDRNAAAKIEYDRVATALKTAEAELSRAEQSRREAETILSYATVVSPFDGKVVDKRVEVGDMVTPGQVMLNLYDPTRMQLVASVRESLTQRLRVGQPIDVYVAALDKQCQGRVSEIVPEAETASRTFSVKVIGPCPPGIYTGMFGRLLIPLDEQEVLVAPRGAVRRVGQLELVDVIVADQAGDTLQRRAVVLGREFNGDVEVLSGLHAGERVALGVRP